MSHISSIEISLPPMYNVSPINPNQTWRQKTFNSLYEEKKYPELIN